MEHIEKITELAEKRRYMDLLLLADPEEDVVMAYLPAGELFVLFADDVAVCEAVMTRRPDGIELKNLATDPVHQKKGYAGRLIEFLCGHYKGLYEAMFVGTAFPGLYERWGFQYVYTVKNFFVDNYKEPIIDEGRLCVDMIYYVRAL